MTSASEHRGHDFAQANKAHFDEHAGKLEEEHPYARELGVITVNTMREHYPSLFDKEHTEVLDYACGIGLVSQALRPYVEHILGVDISQGSVDLFNKQAADKGFASEMKAVVGPLKGEPGERDGKKFDVIICCAAYHHMVSIEETTRILAFFLKPGGSLLVTDLKAAPDGRVLVPETHHHLVPHKHGLTEETMRKTFEEQGLTNFGFNSMPAPEFMAKMFGADLQWFLARGVKPADKA
ncbi:S-adenosyl-L-methionine-dependent methyltransferase [Pilatotrama ljubarskyi]|nr:S-adenosyl-L-methionine-dependent methyltransferase [Pilatotrama ljubarskyi]